MERICRFVGPRESLNLRERDIYRIGGLPAVFLIGRRLIGICVVVAASARGLARLRLYGIIPTQNRCICMRVKTCGSADNADKNYI